MRISVITPTFNSASTLRYNLVSVAGQRYTDVEHIIIDNCSTDGTAELVAKFPHVAKFISESDSGIYNAFNKGIQHATGEIVCFLNSDDFYSDPEVLTTIAHTFQTANCDAVFGNLVYVYRHYPDKIHRVWKSSDFSVRSMLAGWMAPHPTFFLRRSVYLRGNLYNESMRYAADYELMLKLFLDQKISSVRLNRVLVYMRTGGATDKNIFSRLRVHREDYRAWQSVQYRPRFYTLHLKVLRKLHQLILHYYHPHWLAFLPTGLELFQPPAPAPDHYSESESVISL